MVTKFYFMIYSADDGSIYGWGDNEQEQLGFPREEYAQVNRPTVLTALNDVKVRKIVCGYYHTAFISGVIRFHFIFH